ncbi:MAG TPA: secretin N-terminal domain-containing protein [Rhodocyclaceae bacterium]|nr:secretin N-terminal domain-containing protein [Rhodocyclaceae bacterium]
MNKNSSIPWPLLGCALLVAGCATTSPKFEEGRALILQGRTEEGLARLQQAADESPGNAEVRAYLASQRERAVNQLLAQGLAERLNGRFDEAADFYRRAQAIDPNNQRVALAVADLEAERRRTALRQEAATLLEAGKTEKAQVLLRRLLAENPRDREARAMLRRIDELQNREVVLAPKLKSRLSRPITLEFRDASLKAVFEVISRSAGINFVFDRDVKPDLTTTIFVKDTPIEEALRLILMTNGLDRKVLSENSMLVFPNTPAKQRDYQELVMKSFYLANADVKQVGNMLRTMLKTRDVFVDERLNLLMIRDTLDAIRVAEKLIASQDLAEPEALLEVEVLEVSRGRLQNLGVQWPRQIGYGILQGGTTTQTNVPGGAVVETTTPGTTVANGVVDLKHGRGGLVSFVANPAILLNINAQDTLANVLANPRIRVKNREKAKIHIGDRVPVLTSTATATGFVSQSITYLDVGVKLDVEPNIGLEDDVTMKVGLEVSSIAREITSTTGTVAYQVGTRSAGTVLRLRDGETQVLAGLIQDEDRRSASKIPGLGDFPVLGRLFSSNTDNTAKTEIVLLITPHIVRSLTLPAASATEFPAGTEGGIGRIGAGGEGGGAVSGPLPGASPVTPAPSQGAPTAPGVTAPQPGAEPGAPAPATSPAAPAAPVPPPTGGEPPAAIPLSALGP